MLLLMGLFLTLLSISAQDQWLNSFDKALEQAEEKQQTIILSFQGSDWCAPCIKLEKEIWSSDEFKAVAQENWVLLKADFPKRKANRLEKEQQDHNDNLAEKYNPQGYFPLVVILDAEGNTLGKLGYENVSPTAYIEKLSSF